MSANRRKRDKTSKVKYIAWAVIIIAAITALVWWLFFSDFFKIRTIDIAEPKYADYNVIQDIAWEQTAGKSLIFLPHDSIVLYNVDETAKQLKERYFFDELKIVKDFNHRIIIDFKETGYEFNWQENNQTYLISREGEVILTRDRPEPGLIVINNQSQPLKNEQKIKVAPDFLIDASKLDQSLDQGTYGLSNRYFIYDQTPRTIKIQIEEGPVLIFSRAMDFDLQIVKLNTVRQHELREGAKFNAQKYIDLRYGDKVNFDN